MQQSFLVVGGVEIQTAEVWGPTGIVSWACQIIEARNLFHAMQKIVCWNCKKQTYIRQLMSKFTTYYKTLFTRSVCVCVCFYFGVKFCIESMETLTHMQRMAADPFSASTIHSMQNLTQKQTLTLRVNRVLTQVFITISQFLMHIFVTSVTWSNYPPPTMISWLWSIFNSTNLPYLWAIRADGLVISPLLLTLEPSTHNHHLPFYIFPLNPLKLKEIINSELI